MALWDIKSKQAKMPLHQLFGGRIKKNAIQVYTHATSDTMDGLFDQVDRYLEQGYKHIRCQLGFYGEMFKKISILQKTQLKALSTIKTNTSITL